MQKILERERERERKRELASDKDQSDKGLFIKTNLLYLSVGAANLGLEYSFSKRLSVDVPVIYAPYIIKNTIQNNWSLKVLSFQPEIRIRMKECWAGHFAGIHAHIIFYNLADNLYRYQDAGGNTPLKGVGLTYGYVVRGKNAMDRWSMEFVVGAGYANTKYDVFHNVPNGALEKTETKNYWGITKAGISLSYNLISKKP